MQQWARLAILRWNSDIRLQLLIMMQEGSRKAGADEAMMYSLSEHWTKVLMIAAPVTVILEKKNE
jgi:hypothetical protein